MDGISRVTSHQLVRHRLASYNQQSQRYVSYTSPEYVVPPSVEKHPELKEEFERAIKGYFESYRRLQEAGIPAEDARYLLPNAITTRLVVTMNVRELMHSCSIRLCTRAQWEIQELFHRMRDEVRQVAPILGSFLMIKCELLGYCDERECCWIRPPKEEVLGQSPGPQTKQS